MTHTTLSTPQTYHLTTPNSPLTPKICRDTVALLLATNGHTPDLADTARTLVSEVVTNALLHTTSPTIDMETAVLPDGVRVAVYDDNPAVHLAPLDTAWDGEHGRGLLLVQALAQAWGVTPAHPYGRKHVWFELRGHHTSGCPPPRAPEPSSSQQQHSSATAARAGEQHPPRGTPHEDESHEQSR
ncbi:ATP-binding protein [Streptomyces sp. NPDC048275]|uniref:ATP-binding protein n=1 Tax=Streptomyces sp. NPDC048275 TaxID=3155629 RepID=UPI0033E92256